MAKSKAKSKAKPKAAPRCMECGKELTGRDADRSTCHECRSPKGKVADLDIAIRASGDTPKRINEWPAIRGLLRQKFGQEHTDEALWARFTDLLEAGRITPNEYLKRPLGSIPQLLETASRNVEATLNPPQSNAADNHPPKRKRPGRKMADAKTIKREADLAAKWERAKEAGIYKARFAKDHKMTRKELGALLNRVAKRKKRADK